MNNSNAIHNRIITAFPNIAKWKNCDLVISKLIDFFEGEHIHINDTWRQTRGHSSLIANAEVRKVLMILKAVDVRIFLGNDAPRGGALGDYFKCYRKNATASAFFKGLLAEVKIK